MDELNEVAADEPTPSRTSGKAVWSLVLGLLSLGCLFFTGIPAIILGFMGLGDVSRGRGRVGGKGLAILGLLAGAFGTLIEPAVLTVGAIFYAVPKVREAAARTTDSNNLKRIGIAMHSFHNDKGHFPPAADPAPDGRGGIAPIRPPFPKTGPQHPVSWRVLILPYVEGDYLYKQYHFDEPWDGPRNKLLLNQMPKVYSTTAEPSAGGKTRYRVFAGGGALFEKGQPTRIGSISDGTSNTLMVVEAAEPVEWTKPDELEYGPNKPLPKFGQPGAKGFFVLMADGTPHYLNHKDVNDQLMRALITRAGNEVVTLP